MKFLLLCLISLLFTIFSYAQTMTAYEKKCYSLKIQFLRNDGVSETIIKKIKNTTDLESVVKNLYYFTTIEPKTTFLLSLQLAKELKNAEKLKTTVDFQRDKEKKGEAEIKKQNEIVKQKENQHRLDIEHEEKERKEHYNNSDYVYMEGKIKEEFNLWLQKGEFEKIEDYQNRISNNSSITFDSIAAKIINERINTKKVNVNLLKYNADSEKFGIEFSFGDLVWTDSLPILLKNASNFKDDFNSQFIKEIQWCIVDNYLTPKKINLLATKKKMFEFDLPSKNSTDIQINTTELGINPVLLNSVFDYEIWKKKIKKDNKIPHFRIIGDRKFLHCDFLPANLEAATIYVIIKVSAEGRGEFVKFGRNSSTTEQLYADDIIHQLTKMEFDKADHESTIALQIDY